MVQWQDFDFDGKLKIPVGFYLVLLYLLRGYVLWVISLTYRDDPTLILSLIYNDSRLFFYSLLIGVPAAASFVLFSLKSQKQKPWFIKCWKGQRWLLAISLILDLAAQIFVFIRGVNTAHWSQMILLILGVYLLWYWIKSLKIKRFFSNWLLVLEQKKQT